MADAQSLEREYQQWSQSAAAVLAKSRRVEPDQLPGTPEELLSTTTPDSVVIKPLYTRRDELPEPGLPGGAPFVRGADAARDIHLGWRVTERFGDTGSASATDAAVDTSVLNDQILDALTYGASGLWLAVGENGIATADLPQVLQGVLTDLVPITLDAGADGIEAAAALREVLPPEPTGSSTIAGYGLAPLTAEFSGRATVALDAAITVAAEAPATVRAIRVDGTDFAMAGATDAQELALLAAAGIDYLRLLAEKGLSTAAALGQLSFAVSVGDDQFGVIAKLRALRKIWARVATASGAEDAGAAHTHAITALSMYAQRDPWVNMLRSTVSAFGAGIGGADQITVLPFDVTLPPAARTTSAAFARRIARNTQLLLLEESNLGRVLDPAGGAWFVESLTDELAAAAWKSLQEIESRGGYRAVLADGWIADQIATALADRDELVARRKAAITGVNEFPNLAEEPLPASDFVPATATAGLARIAQPFESLRDRADSITASSGSRPTITMLPLGPVSEHNGRTTFIANLLAAGGIAADNPGPVTADGTAAHVSAGSIVVICGTNSRYADEGPALLAAARAAGASQVLLAGPNKAWPDGAEKPDGFLAVGIDAVTTLTGLLDRLEGVR